MKIKKPKIRILFVDLLALLLITSIVFIGILSGKKAGQLLFAISLFSTTGIILTKNKIRLKNIPFILRLYFIICFMALISIFYAEDIQYSMDVLWKIFSAFVIMYFVHYYAITYQKILKLIYFFLFNTFLLATYNILNYQPSIYRELPYGGVNTVALLMFMSIMLIIFLVHIKNWKFLFLVPVFLYVLLLTQSQKSILSILIALILYSVFNLIYLNIKTTFKYIFLSLIILLIGFYFLLEFELLEGAANRTFATIKTVMTNEAVEGAAGGAAGEGLRTRLKEYGWQYFSESPFWGYGINNFRVLYGRQTGLYTYTHYTPLELILGMGIIALPIYYGIYYYLFKINLKKLKIFRMNIFSFLISSIITLVIIGFYMQTYFDAAIHFYLILVFSFNKIYGNESNYEKQN